MYINTYHVSFRTLWQSALMKFFKNAKIVFGLKTGENQNAPIYRGKSHLNFKGIAPGSVAINQAHNWVPWNAIQSEGREKTRDKSV